MLIKMEKNQGLLAAVYIVAIVSLTTAWGSPAASAVKLDISIDSKPLNRSSENPISSYAPILNHVIPSVVSVHTAEVVKIVRSDGPLSPEEEFLRRFFGFRTPRSRFQEPKIEERKVPSGVGSGVIVTSDGVILTNNHVVSDSQGGEADEVLVRLTDGRELKAEIIGRDPQTDVAVLKVDAKGLHAAPIADSENIAVGDIVFAIGNPMGVGLTVTQGIVSATGRSIGIYGEEGYENFIQTDASINPGNSGGALVDSEGRLIGINSAILSRSGGSIGLGFAIPSSLVVSMAEQLVEFGQVRRGYLGVQISDLSKDLANAFDLDSTNGVLVNQVDDGTPAEKAGIERGDVIVSIGERPVNSVKELRLRICALTPGSETKVEVVRKGRKKTFDVKVGAVDESIESGQNVLSGVTLSTLTNEVREKFGIPRKLNGLAVTNIERSSPYIMYLRPGAIILEINDRPLSKLSDLRKALRSGVNKIFIYDRGETGYFAVQIK